MCSCPAFESDEYLCSSLFVQLGPSTTKRAEDFFVFVLNIRTHLLLLSIRVSILVACECTIRVGHLFCLGPGFITLEGLRPFFSDVNFFFELSFLMFCKLLLNPEVSWSDAFGHAELKSEVLPRLLY